MTRRSERRTWVSTAAWRASASVLATLCGVTSATPMSRDVRSDDVASAVGVASATVGQAAQAHTARLTAHGHGWAVTGRTEALAVRSLASEPEPPWVPADGSALEPQRPAAVADAGPNGAIPLSELCSPDAAPGIFLRCDAAEALDRLADAYLAANGRDLRVFSGYRTYERQAEIKRQHGALAAAPGRSNHGRGIAVDLSDMGGLGEFDAPGYLWMKAHAAAFGWHHPPMMEPGGRGPKEPWHWEFGTWSGYDDRGDGGTPPESDRGPRAGIRPGVPPNGPVDRPQVEQPPPPATSGTPEPVVPSIEASAEPPTPPVASTPLEPSTPPDEAPPPTEQDPPQEAPPDGESPPSEESPPAEACSPADENVPAEDSPDAEVPALESPPLEEDAPVDSASPDERPPAEMPPAHGGLSGSGGSPPGAQTPSTDGTGPPPPAEAGACEVGAEVDLG